MPNLGRTLIGIGILLIVTGILLQWSKNFPGLGKLPGDFVMRRNNFTFYFPLATSLLLSIILSLLFYFFNKK